MARDIAKIEGGYDKQRSNERKPDRNKHASKRCAYCGQARTHRDRMDCPAFRKRCNKCQRPNHFAAVCKADDLSRQITTQQRETDDKDKEVRRMSRKLQAMNQTAKVAQMKIS